MSPPTRTGAWGGGGGGAASKEDELLPPSTPPTTPCTCELSGRGGGSGTITRGASTGAAFGLATTTGGVGTVGVGGGGGGGGGGRGGGVTTNAMTDSGVGSMSVAISGTTTSRKSPTACSRNESGTVYHCWVPIFVLGSETSPNMSRGTCHSPHSLPTVDSGRIIVRAKKRCQQNLPVTFDTTFFKVA